MKKKLLLFLLVGIICSTAFTQVFRNEWIDYSKTYYKFKVDFGIHPITLQPIRKKLVRINQPTLQANGLGAISAENFQLFRNGVEIPIYISVATGLLGTSDYIEFWGEINDGKLDNDLYRDPDFQLSDIWSLQEDAGTYFLTINTSGNSKRLVDQINNVLNNTLPPTVYFMNTVSYTNRGRMNEGFAAQATLPLYSSSYDKGEGYTTRPIRPIGSSCSQGTFTVTLNNLKPYLSGPNMTLRINATGSANNARTILIKLNGDTVSNFQMDYYYYSKIEEYGIPVSKIASGSAALQHINQSGVDCDEFRLAKDELVYPRSLDGNNDTSLEIKLPASGSGHYLKFYNFNYGNVPPILYDLTNGRRYIADLSITDTIRFLTLPSATTSNLVLVKNDISNSFVVTNFQQRNFTNFADILNQGDYLIISNPLIYGTGSNNYVEQYKQYRSSVNGGAYNAKLIDINEITDQFAYGVNKHPLSIRNFLKYARSQFAIAPKFVFLIGKGLNYLEFRANESAADIEYQNLVPTWGHPASDNLLSAVSNSNAIPETPIGRLSAVSATEVGNYLAKIKQYDSLQRNSSYSITDKAWMKNILQVAGANDHTIGNQLDNYLAKYKSIIQDTSFGGLVKNYNKIDDPSAYTQSLKEFKSIYENGASLVTYFGHSSATNLDFSLDNPDAYNNQYRYPIFIVNGCDAGNLFMYESQRLNLRTTISEKFVLEPQRGAIGYLSTTNYGVVNYLDSFTTKFYKSFGKIDYNKPFGEVVKNGIASVLNNTGYNDFFARFHSEEFAFHGDPAIRMNGFDKPDFVVEAEQLSLTPSFISVSKDTFYAKIRIYNIGKKTTDSVSLKITRQFPSGNTTTVFTTKFAPIATVDSITIALPIVADRDKGNNIITATIDYTNSIDELSESNNSASIVAIVNEDELIPVYPYNYAIVNNPSFKLSASTANPLAISKTYIMEIDTTTLFNSVLKYVQTKTSVGGVIEFDNGLTLQNNTTYYWRVALQGVNQHWNTSSFTYKGSSTNVGFEQRHFYQHTESSLDRIYLDSSSRKFEFRNKSNNLFMVHSIYPYSGTEDQQFSIQVNGSGIIASACLGQSVIINVFDTLTFKPWENLTNPFGAEPTCQTTRKYNFEYHYIDQSGRDSAKAFLQSIPNGNLVAVRLVYDGDPVWANEWADDTLTNGSNNSLYHFLKNQGLPIDSFNAPRTFGFIFKKNDSTNFSPKYKFSNGLYDRVILSVDFNSKDTLGFVNSPKFGPAKAWKNVKWNGYGTGNNFESLNIIGVSSEGVETKLYTLDTLQTSVDISSVNVIQYPYIKLRTSNQDSITAKAYQLNNWSVEYDAVAEGAIAPNLYFNIPDSVGIATSYASDTLKGGVAFKNISKVNFDSLTVKLLLINQRLGTIYTFNLPKTKILVAGDTVHIDFTVNVALLPQDNYNLYLVINENGTQPEQYLFNNNLYKYVYLKTSVIVPVRLLNFNAKPLGNLVEINWDVTEEINIGKYEIEYSTNALDFNKIGSINAKGVNGNSNYLFYHNNPINGVNYYRLKMINIDGSYSFSPIRVVNFIKTSTIKIYPNPVINSLTVSVNKQDNKLNTVKLYNNVGQLIITKSFAINTQLDLTSLASGTYLIRVDDGTEIKIFTIQKK
jgi:hypothetical protein